LAKAMQGDLFMALTATILLTISTFSDLIQFGGLILILALIFIETAVLLGIFVPGGDSLLVTAGLLCGTQALDINIYLLIGLLILAALSGDMMGFFLGRKIGNQLQKRPSANVFVRRQLNKAEVFYLRYGRLALIAGKFLPFIRTFNPMLSGTTGMGALKFFGYSLLSATIWIPSILLASYYAGQAFPYLGDYLHIILLVMMLVILAPFAYRLIRPFLRLAA
jgi:membrane-associated protein